METKRTNLLVKTDLIFNKFKNCFNEMDWNECKICETTNNSKLQIDSVEQLTTENLDVNMSQACTTSTWTPKRTEQNKKIVN